MRRSFVVATVGLFLTAASCGDSTGPSPTGPAQILFSMIEGTQADSWNAIFVVNPDGTGLKQLTDGSHFDGFGAWSPDGSRIAFTSNRDNGQFELYTMRFDGTGQTRLTHTPPDPFTGPPRLFMASWSSRNTLAFLLQFQFQTHGDIATIPASGGSVTRLTNDTGSFASAVWSPDGSRIAFTKVKPYGSSRIVVMDVDGSDLTLLTTGPGGDGTPDWSPDGSKIAFARSVSTRTDIYIMNADGTGLVQLTTDGAGNISPSWSADGRQIAFVSTRDGPGDIYIMDADGSNVRRVTTTGTHKSGVRWQPR